MQDAFDLPVSPASVQTFAQEAAQTLIPGVRTIGQAVQQSAVGHAEESGMRVQGKLHWLHCAVTTTLSWLKCHAKRGTVAFDAPGLLAGVRGTLVHDGLAGYRQFECAHSRCNAHPLRELVFVHAQEQEKIRDGWARERMELLVPARQEVAHAGGPLPLQRQAWFDRQWERLLERGEAFNRQGMPGGAPRGTQGRHQQSRAFNLLKRLPVQRRDVWRFMTGPGVPLTNTLAEQALRRSRIKQKMSGGFRTLHGADTSFTIRSCLATMQKQRSCLFDCLVSTFTGQPVQPSWAG